MVLNVKNKGIIFIVIMGIIAMCIIIGKIYAISPEGNQPADNEEIADLEEEKGEKERADSFFAEYRMERERVRGKQIEMLGEIIGNQSVEKGARETASLRLVQITEDMEKEMKAEALVKSKGFAECVVIVQQHTTTVVIKTDNLRLDKEKEISELVSRITQYSEENICIITRDL